MSKRELPFEVQWRRKPSPMAYHDDDLLSWRPDAFNRYHESEAEAEAYVRTVAVGGRIEHRVVKRGV